MTDLKAQLLHELTCAKKIILAMLKHMTVAQKCAAGAEIEDAGIAGEGMTRYHERHAVLASATQMEDTDAATPVFCKDCKHRSGGRMARCAAPEVRRTDLVTGYYGPYCQAERSDARLCGPEGRLFQMRHSPSDSNRSSLSNKNLASAAISDSTAATNASEGSCP